MYFSDNLGLADREVLAKVAVSSGLTKTETLELLNPKLFEEEANLKPGGSFYIGHKFRF